MPALPPAYPNKRTLHQIVLTEQSLGRLLAEIHWLDMIRCAIGNTEKLDLHLWLP
jgi:hypothetical protein